MISGFSGEYRFLSNFYPIEITKDGIVYPSAEHAYQAAKTDVMSSKQWIASSKSPGESKRRGRTLMIVNNWDDIKVNSMLEILFLKFNDPYLKQLLLSTGDEHIQEYNTWGDRFWGVCNGEGLNFLGVLLMFVRVSLRQ